MSADSLVATVVGGLALGAIILLVISRFRNKVPELAPKNDKEAKLQAKVKAANKDKKKALSELKKLRELAKPPENVPPETPPLAATEILEQSPISRTIQIELTRIKDGTRKRHTVRKGRVTLVSRFGNKDVFFFYVGKMGYFIDPSQIIKVQSLAGVRNKKTVTTEKLVYDVFNSEPLDKFGNLTWSWDIEHLLRDSAMDQYITVATFEGGFQLTPQLIKATIAIGSLALIMGLALNGSLGLTPTEVIHYVP